MIQNGDFELGDTLFYSEYNYNPRNKNEKTYSVTDNPYLSYSRFDSCGDHTSGFGKMMIVNGDSIPGTVVWRQLVKNIKSGIDYEFSFWHTPINKLRAPVLIVIINGDTLDPNPIYSIDSACNWQQTEMIWNSGTADSAEISIFDASLHVAGNDFAIDDISFSEYCKLQACAGQNLFVCPGKSVQLNANAMDGFEPYTYFWSPATGLDNVNSKNPNCSPSQTTTYILTVTDKMGCKSYDTITVFIYNGPDNSITSDWAMPVCPCQPVKLTAKPGYNYLWSTGDTTQSITASISGNYTVEINDKQGCSSTGNYFVSHKPVNIKAGIDTTYIESGKSAKARIYLFGETNLLDCGYSKFTTDITFNPSVIKPDSKYGYTLINDEQIINFSGDFRDTTSLYIDFTTILGNNSFTDLVLKNLNLTCDSVLTELIAGRVFVTDICYEGGPRLIDLSQQVTLTSKIHSNNLEIDFSVIENTGTALSIYNYSGELISMPLNAILKSGIHQINADISNLAGGLYFVVLQAGNTYKISSFIR